MCVFVLIWFNRFLKMSFSNFLQTCGFVQHVTSKSKSLFDAFQSFGFYMVSPTLRLREDLCRISAPVYFAAEAQPESQAAHCQPSDKIKLWRLYDNAKEWPGSVYNVSRRTSCIPHIQMHWSLVKLRSLIPNRKLPAIFQLLVASLEKLILYHQCSILSPHSIHQVSGSHLDGFGQETIGSTNLRCRLGQSHRTKV